MSYSGSGETEWKWVRKADEKWWTPVEGNSKWAVLSFILRDRRESRYVQYSLSQHGEHEWVYRVSGGTTAQTLVRDILKDATHFVVAYSSDSGYKSHHDLTGNLPYIYEGLAEVLESDINPAPFLIHLGLEPGFHTAWESLAFRRILKAARPSKLEKLMYLKLQAATSGVGETWLDLLVDLIKAGHLPALTSLSLWLEVSVHLHQLANSLRCATNLQHLELQGVRVRLDCISISKLIRSDGLPALRTLILAGCSVGDVGLKAFAKSFSVGRLQRFEKLVIREDRIGDVGAAALATAFRSGKLRSLCKVDLSWNCIGDAGLMDLVSALVAQPGEMKELNVDYNDIGETGIVDVAEVLKSGDLNFLKKFGIHSRYLSKASAQVLLNALTGAMSPSLELGFDSVQFPQLHRKREQIEKQNRKRVELLQQIGGGMVPAAHGKVYLCGNPEVGKTTLRKSLQRSLWKSLGTWETRQRSENRTTGINVSQIKSKGPLDNNELYLAIWDMAGQNEYHLLHNAFLPDLVYEEGKATIFVVVCTSQSKQKAARELEYWFRFIASSCDQTYQNPRQVFVVFNRMNGDPNIMTDADGWKSMLSTKRDKFQGYLEIAEDPFIVDVRTRKQIRSLKEALVGRSRTMLEKEKVPAICQHVQSNLSFWSEKRPEFPVLTWDEFVKEVQRTGAVGPEKTIHAVVKYLNEAGVLIYIDNEFPPEWRVPDRKLVVLDPNWFCMEIVGKVFLPHSMKETDEPLFREKVDQDTGSISIRHLKEFFESLFGKWKNSEVEDLLVILLWLGLCYKGRQENVFIPALIYTDQPHGDCWGDSYSPELESSMWVMGYCVEHAKSSIALAPIALWHRFQVELAQTPKFNGARPDNDFMAGKYFVTFKVDYMAVLIEVNADEERPTFDRIEVLVKPLRKKDDLDPNTRRRWQVDLAGDLVETLLNLWDRVCPGVEYTQRVVWPWLASMPRPANVQKRNVDVAEVKKWVQQGGGDRQMQWMVGSDPITENVLLSTKHKQAIIKSMQGVLEAGWAKMKEVEDLLFSNDDSETD